MGSGFGAPLFNGPFDYFFLFFQLVSNCTRYRQFYSHRWHRNMLHIRSTIQHDYFDIWSIQVAERSENPTEKKSSVCYIRKMNFPIVLIAI